MSNQCPSCGRPMKPEPAYNTKLKRAIEQRLTEYGYVPGMNPTKYTAYTAIRTTIMIRIEKHPLNQKPPYGVNHGHGIATEEDFDYALWMLDVILPPKEDAQ